MAYRSHSARLVLTGKFCQAWLVGTVTFPSESEIHLAVRGNEQPECLAVVPMRNVIFDYRDDREPARFFVLRKNNAVFPRTWKSAVRIATGSSRVNFKD